MYQTVQYLCEITFSPHDSESELLFLDKLVVFYYFLTEPEVFQGLLWSSSLTGTNCWKEQNVYRAIVNNRLSIAK